MDLAAIRMECRVLMDDAVEPYLVADEVLNERINEAIREACTRADLIIDSTTSEVCTIEVTAGVNQYGLSPLIQKVKVASLASRAEPLIRSGYKRLHDESDNWLTRTGKPRAYVMDYDTNTIVLSHLPETDDTLNLVVRRLPIADLVEETDEPEIKAQYHRDLIWWVLHLTYLTNDADLFDPQASERYETKFERRFGARPTAEEQERELRSYARRAKAHFL